MKSRLFTDTEMEDTNAVIQTLEAENCGVEELHDFLRPFTEDEQKEVENQFLLQSKSYNALQKELDTVSAPLKEKMKPVAKETKRLIDAIQKGGTIVNERVYCYRDDESNMIGLYDSRGILVGTRPMTRAEKQLHINSSLRRAVGE